MKLHAGWSKTQDAAGDDVFEVQLDLPKGTLIAKTTVTPESLAQAKFPEDIKKRAEQSVYENMIFHLAKLGKLDGSETSSL